MFGQHAEVVFLSRRVPLASSPRLEYLHQVYQVVNVKPECASVVSARERHVEVGVVGGVSESVVLPQAC